ncbi:MAG: endonuclease/exonuclease/phosphatase family protein [Bdellovibrionales bacterium]
MRVLTLNLWHGLAPTGQSTFAPLESNYRRRRREELQLEALKAANLDLIFLQEVNPLGVRGPELAKNLSTQVFSHHDLVGLKVRGLGWPWNLNSGLATLVPGKYAPRDLGAVKLSGSKWSGEMKWLSWQWSESRYAVVVEFLDSRFGRVLAVNCHLHHGLEMDEPLKRQIQLLADQGILSANAAQDLKERLQQTNHRREQEVTALLDQIEAVRDRYTLILLGGDFNCTPESAAYGHIKQFGFHDLWHEKNQNIRGGFTFDETRNQASHIFTQKFPLTIETEDLSFSPKTKQTVLDLLQGHERRQRRIDYLFARLNGPELRVKSVELFGVPGADDIALSDHFGVLAELG